MKVLVPTCNRPELFHRLVTRLDGFDVIGFINNSTEDNILKYKSLELPENTKIVFTDISGEPKSCHVATFQLMLRFASDECMILEDDVYPCDDFRKELSRQIELLKSVTHDFTLSPLYLPNRNSDFYTGNVSRMIDVNGVKFIDQAWVDGNFFMTKSVLEAMKKWLINVQIFNASSGVGRKNAYEIARRNWKMYTSVPTLVEHLDHDSVMFGARRKQIPLIARFGVI